MKLNEFDENEEVVEWNLGQGQQGKRRGKCTQTSFRTPRNPHGMIEPRTLDPSGGRRAPSRLRHGAA